MGNVALVEDILRVAAGATGEEIGGDKIYSDILRMSENKSSVWLYLESLMTFIIVKWDAVRQKEEREAPNDRME